MREGGLSMMGTGPNDVSYPDSADVKGHLLFIIFVREDEYKNTHTSLNN